MTLLLVWHGNAKGTMILSSPRYRGFLKKFVKPGLTGQNIHPGEPLGRKERRAVSFRLLFGGIFMDFSLQDGAAWSIKPLAQRDVAQPG